MNYKNIYDSIILKSKLSNRKKGNGIYYESHHIIPKCVGGNGNEKQWKVHPNITLLTPKEHWICHLLLCEIYPNEPKLKLAMKLMMLDKKNGLRNYIISAKQYDRIRINSAEANRQIALLYGERNVTYRKNISTSKLGNKNGMYGRTGNKNSLSKKVLQLLNGVVINEYESIHQAAKAIIGDATKIVAVCKGKRNLHKNFGWKYKEN